MNRTALSIALSGIIIILVLIAFMISNIQPRCPEAKKEYVFKFDADTVIEKPGYFIAIDTLYKSNE